MDKFLDLNTLYGIIKRMLSPFLQKHISLLMVMVIFTISVTGFCRSAHSSDFSADLRKDETVSKLESKEKPCPFSPVDEHAAPDHCDCSCNCPCHAPLAAHPVQAVYLPLSTSLSFFEPFKALPEVYLKKFIPPRLLV